MLYYTQACFIIFYNKFAFTDECEAWIHGSKQEKAFRKMNRQPELSTTTSSLNITPASKINTILFLSPTSKPISINSGKKVGGASFANLRFLSNAKLVSEAYPSLRLKRKRICSSQILFRFRLPTQRAQTPPATPAYVPIKNAIDQ